VLDRFRSLAVGRQLVIAIGGVVLLTALLVGAWTMLRTPYRPLFTGLKPADAAAIVGELQHKKSAYRLADGGTTVLVPADKVDATRLDLMNGTLALKGTVGFELFNKSDMGLTDFAQRINYQRALQGELERTIMALDGVDSARVHLSLGEDRIFRQDRVPPKASVTLHMRADASLPAVMATGIQRLVAAAVPQLEPTDVVILDERGEIIGASSAPTGQRSTTTDEGQAVGDYYAARIRAALRPSFGDHVQVQAHADLTQTGEQANPFDGAARSFPLQVTLAADSSVEPAVHEDIQTVTTEAAHLDPARGDVINFGPITRPADVATSPALPMVTKPVATVAPAVSSEEAESASSYYRWSALLVAILAGATIFLLRSRARVRTLSPAQRAKLAARLDDLLEREEARDGIRA